MADAGARLRRGAHRTRRDPVALLIGLTLAIVAAVAISVAMLLHSQRQITPKVSTTGLRGSTHSASPSRTAPSVSASTTPTATHSPTVTASGTPTGTASGSATTTPAALEVTMLNGTHIKGIGGRAAVLLRGGGWTVPVVGNFRGNIAATTVYYPVGHEAQAAAVAALLPGPDRIRPRFSGLSTSRLTVILESDFQG